MILEYTNSYVNRLTPLSGNRTFQVIGKGVKDSKKIAYAFTGDKKFGGFSSLSLSTKTVSARMRSFAPMFYDGPAMDQYWA